MTWRTAAIAAVALATAFPAFAGQPTGGVKVKVTTPEPTRPESQKRISLNYRGPLREAVKRIADDGKLNVVVRGGLDEQGEFHFENVPAEEALTTLASAYNLALEQHGSVFTLRPLTGAEQAMHIQHEMERLQQRTPRASVGPVPPLPPIPPVPPLPALAPRAPDADDEDAESDTAEATDDAETAAEERRAAAEERRTAAQERREAIRERVREIRERVRGLSHRSSSSGCEVSATGNYVVEEGTEACEVSVIGGNLEILGHVTGDVAVFGGNVHLGSDAEVDGDVVAFGGEVTKDDGAEIHGEQLSLGGSGAGMASKGAKAWKKFNTPHSEHSTSSRLSWKLPNLLLQFAVYFGLSFLFLMFAPARMKQIEGELKRDPVKCGVAGLLGGIALLPMSVFLAVTIIGIPFVLVLWLVVALGTAMGFSSVAAEIGTRLPVLKPSRKTQAAVLALGIGVLLLVEMIPYLGPLVLMVVALVSLGAVIRTRFGGKAQGFPEPI